MTSALYKGRLLLPLLSLFVLLTACDSTEVAPDTAIDFGEASYQLSEASDGLDVQILLDRPADAELTIPLTYSGSAIAGEDYETPAEEITIASGSESATLTVSPIDNASLDTQARTIEIAVDASELEGYVAGSTAQTTIQITDDEMVGSYTLAFEEASYQTNESEEETLQIPITVSQPVPAEVTIGLQTGGSAPDANYELLTPDVTIPANATSGTVEVAITNTQNYGGSETLTLSLVAPDNDAFELGGTTQTEIEIVHPIADVAVFAPDESFARIYAYNTFEDVAVPETGRQNSDASAGVVFDESFAFTIYPLREDAGADPNVFGFGSPLWSEENFTRNTNILNMVEFYSGGGPNTVDADVSSGSAGLYYPKFFRLTPDAPGATTGTVSLVVDEVTVYQRDQTDDGVTNPPSFTVGLSGGGTYDEAAGTINVTITFDETAVGNGTVTRRFELSERRPSS